MPVQINFSEIFDHLKISVVGLAQSTVSNYISDAKKDAQNLLTEIKSDLERWTNQLIKGDLTTKDFEWLVNCEKDSIKMAALEQAGLAMIRIDQFKNSVLNLVVDTVFNMIKI